MTERYNYLSIIYLRINFYFFIAKILSFFSLRHDLNFTCLNYYSSSNLNLLMNLIIANDEVSLD
jgi:hypothetical protein